MHSGIKATKKYEEIPSDIPDFPASLPSNLAKSVYTLGPVEELCDDATDSASSDHLPKKRIGRPDFRVITTDSTSSKSKKDNNPANFPLAELATSVDKLQLVLTQEQEAKQKKLEEKNEPAAILPVKVQQQSPLVQDKVSDTLPPSVFAQQDKQRYQNSLAHFICDDLFGSLITATVFEYSMNTPLDLLAVELPKPSSQATFDIMLQNQAQARLDRLNGFKENSLHRAAKAFKDTHAGLYKTFYVADINLSIYENQGSFASELEAVVTKLLQLTNQVVQRVGNFFEIDEDQKHQSNLIETAEVEKILDDFINLINIVVNRQQQLHNLIERAKVSNDAHIQSLLDNTRIYLLRIHRSLVSNIQTLIMLPNLQRLLDAAINQPHTRIFNSRDLNGDTFLHAFIKHAPNLACFILATYSALVKDKFNFDSVNNDGNTIFHLLAEAPSCFYILHYYLNTLDPKYLTVENKKKQTIFHVLTKNHNLWLKPNDAFINLLKLHNRAAEIATIKDIDNNTFLHLLLLDTRIPLSINFKTLWDYLLPILATEFFTQPNRDGQTVLSLLAQREDGIDYLSKLPLEQLQANAQTILPILVKNPKALDLLTSLTEQIKVYESNRKATTPSLIQEALSVNNTEIAECVRDTCGISKQLTLQYVDSRLIDFKEELQLEQQAQFTIVAMVSNIIVDTNYPRIDKHDAVVETKPDKKDFFLPIDYSDFSSIENESDEKIRKQIVRLQCDSVIFQAMYDALAATSYDESKVASLDVAFSPTDALLAMHHKLLHTDYRSHHPYKHPHAYPHLEDLHLAKHPLDQHSLNELRKAILPIKLTPDMIHHALAIIPLIVTWQTQIEYRSKHLQMLLSRRSQQRTHLHALSSHYRYNAQQPIALVSNYTSYQQLQTYRQSLAAALAEQKEPNAAVSIVKVPVLKDIVDVDLTSVDYLAKSLSTAKKPASPEAKHFASSQSVRAFVIPSALLDSIQPWAAEFERFFNSYQKIDPTFATKQNPFPNLNQIEFIQFILRNNGFAVISKLLEQKLITPDYVETVCNILRNPNTVFIHVQPIKLRLAAAQAKLEAHTQKLAELKESLTKTTAELAHLQRMGLLLKALFSHIKTQAVTHYDRPDKATTLEYAKILKQDLSALQAQLIALNICDTANISAIAQQIAQKHSDIPTLVMLGIIQTAYQETLMQFSTASLVYAEQARVHQEKIQIITTQQHQVSHYQLEVMQHSKPDMGQLIVFHQQLITSLLQEAPQVKAEQKSPEQIDNLSQDQQLRIRLLSGNYSGIAVAELADPKLLLQVLKTPRSADSHLPLIFVLIQNCSHELRTIGAETSTIHILQTLINRRCIPFDFFANVSLLTYAFKLLHQHEDILAVRKLLTSLASLAHNQGNLSVFQIPELAQINDQEVKDSDHLPLLSSTLKNQLMHYPCYVLAASCRSQMEKLLLQDHDTAIQIESITHTLQQFVKLDSKAKSVARTVAHVTPELVPQVGLIVSHTTELVTKRRSEREQVVAKLFESERNAANQFHSLLRQNVLINSVNQLPIEKISPYADIETVKNHLVKAIAAGKLHIAQLIFEYGMFPWSRLSNLFMVEDDTVLATHPDPSEKPKIPLQLANHFREMGDNLFFYQANQVIKSYKDEPNFAFVIDIVNFLTTQIANNIINVSRATSYLKMFDKILGDCENLASLLVKLKTKHAQLHQYGDQLSPVRSHESKQDTLERTNLDLKVSSLLLELKQKLNLLNSKNSHFTNFQMLLKQKAPNFDIDANVDITKYKQCQAALLASLNQNFNEDFELIYLDLCLYPEVRDKVIFDYMTACSLECKGLLLDCIDLENQINIIINSYREAQVVDHRIEPSQLQQPSVLHSTSTTYQEQKYDASDTSETMYDTHSDPDDEDYEDRHSAKKVVVPLDQDAVASYIRSGKRSCLRYLDAIEDISLLTKYVTEPSLTSKVPLIIELIDNCLASFSNPSGDVCYIDYLLVLLNRKVIDLQFEYGNGKRPLLVYLLKASTQTNSWHVDEVVARVLCSTNRYWLEGLLNIDGEFGLDFTNPKQVAEVLHSQKNSIDSWLEYNFRETSAEDYMSNIFAAHQGHCLASTTPATTQQLTTELSEFSEAVAALEPYYHLGTKHIYHDEFIELVQALQQEVTFQVDQMDEKANDVLFQQTNRNLNNALWLCSRSKPPLMRINIFEILPDTHLLLRNAVLTGNIKLAKLYIQFGANWQEIRAQLILEDQEVQSEHPQANTVSSELDRALTQCQQASFITKANTLLTLAQNLPNAVILTAELSATLQAVAENKLTPEAAASIIECKSTALSLAELITSTTILQHPSKTSFRTQITALQQCLMQKNCKIDPNHLIEYITYIANTLQLHLDYSQARDKWWRTGMSQNRRDSLTTTEDLITTQLNQIIDGTITPGNALIALRAKNTTAADNAKVHHAANATFRFFNQCCKPLTESGFARRLENLNQAVTDEQKPLIGL